MEFALTLLVGMLLIHFCRSYSSYTCVFGFSTGHVGTGTLSDRDSYKNTEDIEFLFEGYRLYQPPSIKSNPKRDFSRVSHVTYRNGFSEFDETKFVKTRLSSFFNRIMMYSRKNLVVDLGHANLFYYRGIAEYFVNPNKTWHFCKELHFIRIRRSRYEAAKSLMFKSPGHPKKDLCNDVNYGYCPYKNPDAVLLRPLSEDVWNKLDVFSQMLWFIDETEARWQAFKERYKNSRIKMTEVYWSSKAKSPQEKFDRALETVAAILGTQAIPGGNNQSSLKHVHANLSLSSADANAKKILVSSGDKELTEKMRNVVAERRYMEAMGKTSHIAS